MRSKDLNRRALLNQSVRYLEVDMEIYKARLVGMRQERNSMMRSIQQFHTELTHWDDAQRKRLHHRYSAKTAQIHALERDVQRRGEQLSEYRVELAELED